MEFKFIFKFSVGNVNSVVFILFIFVSISIIFDDNIFGISDDDKFDPFNIKPLLLNVIFVYVPIDDKFEN
jgi:hypothetical protein